MVFVKYTYYTHSLYSVQTGEARRFREDDRFRVASVDPPIELPHGIRERELWQLLLLLLATGFHISTVGRFKAYIYIPSSLHCLKLKYYDDTNVIACPV